MFGLTGQARPLTSSPAALRRWRLLGVLSGVHTGEVGSPPEISYSETSLPEVSALPEVSSPDTSPKASSSLSEADKCGVKDGEAKKRDRGTLPDRVLILETKHEYVVQSFVDIKNNFNQAKADILLVLKLAFGCIVTLMGFGFGSIVFKLLYSDEAQKVQAQKHLEEVIAKGDDHVKERIEAVHKEVGEVSKDVIKLCGEFRGVRGEIKGVLETLRSHWF